MKVFKDSVIYVMGELLAKAMPFILIPYLSRRLGTEGYGQLAYYQTYLALYVIIISLSQDGAIARYFYFYGKKSINLVVRAGYSYAIFIGSIALIVSYFLQSKILFYVSLAALFQVFINVQLSVRQCQKQVIPYISVQLLSALMSFLLTIGFLEFYENGLVEKRFLAIVFANVVTFLFAYYTYKRKINTTKKFSLRSYKAAFLYIMSFGLPLIFHHLSLFIKGQLDRFFIYHQYTDSELGIYAMGANLSMVLSVFLMAVNKAIVPHYYGALKHQTITIHQIMKWAFFTLISVPVVVLFISAMPEDLFLWLLGSQFVGVKHYFLLFTVAVLLSVPYLVMVNYLFYHGRNKQIALCSVLSTIIYLVGLCLLVKIKIEYIPFASILGAVSVLPLLFIMIKKVSEEV